MFIEIGEPERIKPVLDALLGIDTRDYVRLQVGPDVVGRVQAGIPTRAGQAVGRALRAVRAAAGRPPALCRGRGGAGLEHPNERGRTVLTRGRATARPGSGVRRGRLLALAGATWLVLAGCSQTSSARSRARTPGLREPVHACHAFDPSQPGPVGGGQGSSRELLRRRSCAPPTRRATSPSADVRDAAAAAGRERHSRAGGVPQVETRRPGACERRARERLEPAGLPRRAWPART